RPPARGPRRLPGRLAARLARHLPGGRDVGPGLRTAGRGRDRPAPRRRPPVPRRVAAPTDRPAPLRRTPRGGRDARRRPGRRGVLRRPLPLHPHGRLRGRPDNRTADRPRRGVGTSPRRTRIARMTDSRLILQISASTLVRQCAHRDGFRLETDADPEVGFLERFKPIGELALICTVLFREGVSGSRQTRLARQLLDHAWRESLDGGRMLVRGQRTEPISPIPFEVYLPFRELGYSQPEVERAAVLNHRLDGWAAFETTPTRRLGLSAFQRRFGLTPRPPEAEALHRTWLARTPEPWTVEGHIAYDITHCVFHLTDWGEHPEGLPPHLAAYLAPWLPAWLDDWLDPPRCAPPGHLLAGAARRRTSPTTSPPGCRCGSTTGSTCGAGTCSANSWWSTPACPAPRSTRPPGRRSPPPSSRTVPCPPCGRCPWATPTRSSTSSTTPRSSRRSRPCWPPPAPSPRWPAPHDGARPHPLAGPPAPARRAAHRAPRPPPPGARPPAARRAPRPPRPPPPPP